MKSVTLYTTENCSRCVSAKMLLSRRNIAYEEVNLARDPDGRAHLADLTGMLTFPLIGDNGTGTWANQLGSGALEHTVLTALGVHNGRLAVTPVLAAVAAAIVLAALATPRTRLGDVRPALAAVLGWAVVSIVGPTVAGDPVTPLDDGPAALSLIAVAAVASLAGLLALRYRERRAERAPGRLAVETPTP